MALPATQLGPDISTEQIKQYEEGLINAIKVIDNSLEGENVSDLDLKKAMDVIEKAFDAGSPELYDLLQIGKIIESRHQIADVLGAETEKKKKGLVIKNRNKLGFILKKVQEYKPAEEIKKRPDLKVVPPPPMEKIFGREEFIKWLANETYNNKKDIDKAIREYYKEKYSMTEDEFENLIKDFEPLYTEIISINKRAPYSDLTEEELREIINNIVFKKIPNIKLPEARPLEIPKDMPDAIFKILNELTAYKRNIFINAWNIALDNQKNNLSKKDLTKLKNKISLIKETEGEVIIKSSIENLIKDYEDILGKESESELEIRPLEEGPSDKEMRNVLRFICDNPESEKKINRIFDLKIMDPNYIVDGALKLELQKIKEEIDILIYQDIFEIYKITDGSQEEKIEKLKKLRLRTQRNTSNVETINKELDDLLVFIDKFENKLRAVKKSKDEEVAPARSKTKTAKPKPVVSDATDKTKKEAEEPTPEATPAPTPEPKESTPESGASNDKNEDEDVKSGSDDKKDEDKKSDETKEESETVSESISKEIDKIMGEILSDKSVYHPKDPASLAIKDLINSEMRKEESNFTLLGLKGFLQKPNVTLTDSVNKYINYKTIDLKIELQNIEDEIGKLNQQIETDKDRLRNPRTKEDEAEKIKKELAEKYDSMKDKRNNKNAVETAIKFKNGTMRYRSTQQVLAMINVYLKMQLGGEKPSEKEIVTDVQRQIDGKRTEAYGAMGQVINSAFGVLTGFSLFKPGLKATLKNLEKDELLNKIGAENFIKLSKAWNSKGDVEAWVENLEGGTEKVMTKTVPRIIAYLEMSLRDGNMTYMSVRSGYKARKLLEHLKDIRHEYILSKVESSSANLSDIEKMNLYFKELNTATVNHNNLTKKIISRRAGWRALGIAGLAVGGIVGGPLVLAGLAASGGTIALGKASAKEKDPEKKSMLKKLTLRTGLASGIGIGAAAINPLFIPLAIAGAISPELWNRRKEIGKGAAFTGKTGWLLTKALLTVGLTGGLALFSKGGRNMAFGGFKDLLTKKA